MPYLNELHLFTIIAIMKLSKAISLIVGISELDGRVSLPP